MASYDVAKKLTFNDLSVTLNQLVEDGSCLSLKSTLDDLTSSYDQHCQGIDGRISQVRAEALKQLQGSGGGRQILKRQLQSLKSSLLNLGQKELFSEAILSFSDLHDYKAEADRSSAALESAEEDLKDLKKTNQQDEEHLREAIRMIEGYQEQSQQVTARLALKLDAVAKEVESLEGGMGLLLPSPLPFAGSEEELESLLANASLLAMTLESDLARTEACCRDLEGDVQGDLAEIGLIEAEIARHDALKQDEARLTEDRHASCLAWCDATISILAKTTGVSLLSIKEDSVCLTITQATAEASEAAARNYVLSAQLKPGSSALDRASLSPAHPNVDMEGLVEFARQAGGGLPLLLTLVQGALLEDEEELSS